MIIKYLYESGDPVRLIREPNTKGHVIHVYERNVLAVRFLDGTTEICQPEEVEPN